MADLVFTLFDLDGRVFQVNNLISYELCQDADAPCDSLSLRFLCKCALPEILSVEAKADGKRVFFGYVDTQREEKNNNGFVCFIYARSSACLLTDSEAKPKTYYSASTGGLWKANCENLGFEYALGDIYCDYPYQVSKGTSVFGALQKFVYGVTGKSIRVSPDNVVEVMKTKNRRSNMKNILSIKRIINRANALAEIRYKLNSEQDYIYRRESEFIKGRRITASVMKNLSSVEDWQRDRLLSSMMADANSEYYTYEISMLGYNQVELMDEVEIQDEHFGEVYGVAFSIVHSLDENGEKTFVKIKKQLDLEERTYVDE